MMKYYAGIYKKFDKELYVKLCNCFPAIDRKMRKKNVKGYAETVGLLLAVSMRPEILVLDEPVDGLDPVMKENRYGIFFK